jgi:hypothetical protein
MRYFLLLIVTTSALCAADGVSDAERIAASAMRERANALSDPLMTRALTELAKSLEEGRTSLTQARAALEVIVALPPASSSLPKLAKTPSSSEAGNSGAGDVTSLLDRDLSTEKPTSPAREMPAEPAAEPSDSVDDAKPEAKSAGLTASVLAMREGAGDKPTLVMIDKGGDAAVRMGQTVRIMHDGATVVKCKIVLVKPTMSMCQLLTDTWTGSDRLVKEGDQAVVE